LPIFWKSSRGCWTRKRPKRRGDPADRRLRSHPVPTIFRPRTSPGGRMEHSFGPYLEIARIQSEMNKLFDVLLVMKEDKEGGAQASAWIPSVDVCQTPDGLIVRAEVPGVPVETLKLSALGGALIIRGERPRTQPAGQAKFHCMERTGGKFR